MQGFEAYVVQKFKYVLPNPFDANIVIRLIFNGNLADMFSDDLANLDK